MQEAWDRRDLSMFLDALDRDYVPRYGYLSEVVPSEYKQIPGMMDYIKGSITDRAKYMGATVPDIDSFTVDHSTNRFIDSVRLTWRIRRD
jgi:hypothetical protein